MSASSGQLVVAAAAWRLASPEVLLLLVLVPLVGIGLWTAFIRQRRALAAFAGATPQHLRPSQRRAVVKLVLVSLGSSFLIVAIARPQANPIEENTTVRGRDIAFVVDVSRSMLSRDVVPSRLERAKLWIKDLTNTLRGDRVALVAFAGVPVVQSPLTLDYGFFRMALDELSPASSPRGGTLIGDAIRKTTSDVFEPGVGRFRDIILITDGEDQGSFPVEAAQKAGELGVRIIAIGIGSELDGSPVPAKDGSGKNYLEYEGHEVRSKLDPSTLAKITQAAAQARGDAAGGVFLNVGTGTIDLDRVYHDLIASAEQRETQAKANVVYRELFPYFLALALACLGVEPLVPVRIRRRAERRVSAGRLGVLAAIAVVCATPALRAQATETPPPAPASTDPAALYNSGRELFLAGKYAEASEAFRNADLHSKASELSNRARFNLGQALLKQATADPKADPGKTIPQLDQAARAFRGALAVNPKDAEAARNVEIARRLMKEAQRQQSEQQQSGDKGDSKDKQDKSSQKQDGKDGQQGDQSQEAQQHQDNADALKELAEQQSQAADTSRESQEQKDQAGKDAKAEEAKSEQSQVNDKTKQEQQKLDKAGKQAQQAVDEARKEQQAASEALDRKDTKGAEEHQRKAADLLKQAAAAEQSAAEQAKEKQGKGQEAKEQESKEPPRDETAAQLLDREKRQREARQQILRALKGRVQPVEKDW